MAESKYEKYVVRKSFPIPMRPDDNLLSAFTTNHPILRYLTADEPVKGANQWIEYSLTWKPHTVSESHKHDFDEIFFWVGHNQEDLNDLGGEVEFWMGEGDEREKIVLTTSSTIYVPPDMEHYPITFKNVKKPVEMIVFVPRKTDDEFADVDINVKGK